MKYISTIENQISISAREPVKSVELLAHDQEIMPGQLLTETQHKRCVPSGGRWSVDRLFAVENLYQGKEMTDVYAQGSRVMCKVFLPGDEIYSLRTSIDPYPEQERLPIHVGGLLGAWTDGRLYPVYFGELDRAIAVSLEERPAVPEEDENYFIKIRLI